MRITSIFSKSFIISKPRLSFIYKKTPEISSFRGILQCHHNKRQSLCHRNASSFIQTITVGFGISPNHAPKRSRTIPPIGNFTLPRRTVYLLSSLFICLTTVLVYTLSPAPSSLFFNNLFPFSCDVRVHL